MTPEELKDQKDVEYYASCVDAWFSTALEHDKSILTLSAGGIGLLITLLTTVGISSAEALVLYVAAILSFLTALIAVLVVYRRNRAHIEQVISKKSVEKDPVLTRADAVVLWSFALGVLFTAVIGIGSAARSYVSQEKKVTNDSTKTSQPAPLKESFNGVSNLQPCTDFTKSFNGVGGLAPQNTTQDAQTSAAGTVSTQTTQSEGGQGK